MEVYVYITCKALELWGRLRNSPIRIEFNEIAAIKVFCWIFEIAGLIHNMTLKNLQSKGE